MSSREIAELTGKRHADVKRDIRNMLNELGLDASSFAHIYKDASGRDQDEFNLPKDLTFTLVLGYDVKRRYAVTQPSGAAERSARICHSDRESASEPVVTLG